MLNADILASPALVTLMAAASLGFILLFIYFLIGVFRSNKSFWAYIDHLDLHYPVKPNSRILLRKLGSVSNSVDAVSLSNQRVILSLNKLASDAENVKQNLVDIANSKPDIKSDLKRITNTVDDMLYHIRKLGGDADAASGDVEFNEQSPSIN